MWCACVCVCVCDVQVCVRGVYVCVFVGACAFECSCCMKEMDSVHVRARACVTAAAASRR